MAQTTTRLRTPALPPIWADPGEVGRVRLLYSVPRHERLLKWIADEYEADVVTAQPSTRRAGEDYDVIEGKRAGSARSTVTRSTRARSSRATFVLPAIKANALYGRRLTRCSRRSDGADRKARGSKSPRDRLRHVAHGCHRHGQTTSADRGHDRDADARAQGDRSCARLADGPRRGDRVCPSAGIPGQGRDRGHALLDRQQPLGALCRRSRWIEDRRMRRGRRFQLVTPPSWRGRAAGGRRCVRARPSRWRWTGSGSGWWSCWRGTDRDRDAHGVGSSTTIEDRIAA